MDSDPLSCDIIRLTFGSLNALPDAVAQRVGKRPVGMVITLCMDVSVDEMARFAERLIRIVDCTTVCCRGALRDKLEYAIDMAIVLRELEDSDARSVQDGRGILTVSTDESVDDCINIMEPSLLKGGCVAVVATQL